MASLAGENADAKTAENLAASIVGFLI